MLIVSLVYQLSLINSSLMYNNIAAKVQQKIGLFYDDRVASIWMFVCLYDVYLMSVWMVFWTPYGVNLDFSMNPTDVSLDYYTTSIWRQFGWLFDVHLASIWMVLWRPSGVNSDCYINCLTWVRRVPWRPLVVSIVGWL